MNREILKSQKYVSWILSAGMFVAALCLSGCGGSSGYSNEPLYPDQINTIYVKMFDNQGMRRGIEYKLSEALAKRIEVETPYKIVTSMDRADTVISGYISGVGETMLTTERQTGQPLEKEVELRVIVNWKNLKTGEFLIENLPVSSSASYSEWLSQSFDYASAEASNKLARRIVQLMEKPW
ncbi:MAG: LPS assembly lipoprotein LptE [Planctomycetota bacterium]|jgi:hypothetical protein